MKITNGMGSLYSARMFPLVQIRHFGGFFCNTPKNRTVVSCSAKPKWL